MRNEWSTTNQSGFSLIEIILSLTLFAGTIMVMVTAFLEQQESTRLAGERTRAVLLAKEAYAALRNIRDNNFELLTTGTHGLEHSEGAWSLTDTPDTQGIYTRKITISDTDEHRKNIWTNITWKQNELRSGSISFFTQLTKWIGGSWSSPIEVDALDLSGNNDDSKIQVKGDHAYLIRNKTISSLAVIAFTDSAGPSLVAELNLGTFPKNIFILDDYAYIVGGDGDKKLIIVDISTPSSPSIRSTTTLTGTDPATGVYVLGDYAYITSDGDDEFVIVDVSNTSSPSTQGSVNLDEPVKEVVVKGDYAYLASTDEEEFHAIDVSNKLLPTNIGGADLPTNLDASSIAYYGNYAYIGQGNLIRSVDISNQSAPSLEDTLDLGNTVTDIALNMGVDNARLFVSTTDSLGEFVIVDISDPSNLSQHGVHDITSNDSLTGVAYDETTDRAMGSSISTGRDFILFAPD